jgi:K+-sensing histidine kinase KdpD
MDTQFDDLKGPGWLRSVERIALSVLAVAALTGLMYLVGREQLGEGVIALLYLIPISWSTARWGLGPGIAAAITASLSFNFFFIPPYYTFYIGRLEGWLIFIIFTLIAVMIVTRLQAALAKAQEREREAVFMYELSMALAGAKSITFVARVLAEHVQQLYQANLVQVSLQQEEPHKSVVASAPGGTSGHGRPDRLVPIMAGSKLVGEICIWKGIAPLPSIDNRLLQNFANQGGLALERFRV